MGAKGARAGGGRSSGRGSSGSKGAASSSPFGSAGKQRQGSNSGFGLPKPLGSKGGAPIPEVYVSSPIGVELQVRRRLEHPACLHA